MRAIAVIAVTVFSLVTAFAQNEVTDQHYGSITLWKDIKPSAINCHEYMWNIVAKPKHHTAAEITKIGEQVQSCVVSRREQHLTVEDMAVALELTHLVQSTETMKALGGLVRANALSQKLTNECDKAKR